MDLEARNRPLVIDPDVVKPAAVGQIRDRLGQDHGGGVEGVVAVLAEARRRYGPTFNAHVQSVPGAGDERVEIVHPADSTAARTPNFLNGRPDMFPATPSNAPWTFDRPDYRVAHARDATLRLIPDAPVLFDRDGRVLEGYSTAYWPLLHFYDGAEAHLRRPPRPLDGPALVLIDDLWDDNYCHWLVEWLPRLSLLGDRVGEVYVLTRPLTSAFQAETLVACGVDRERIVPMTPWDAITAPEVIAQAYVSDVIHPAFRGATWATSYLKDRLSPAAPEPGAPRIERLYVSRADAGGRRVLNETALLGLLERYGYRAVTLSGRTVAEQARLFNDARHIIALHGAGLTNIVFSRDDVHVVEIFAETYGTLSFWALASTAGKAYSVYVADRVVAASRTQIDDVEIDLDAFERIVLLPLHGPGA